MTTTTVTLGDLDRAAADTAALTGSGASLADRLAAADREMELADLHDAVHGTAVLDAAATADLDAYASAHPAPDTWAGAATEHEPEAGA